jgi:hypothetical protein
MKKKPFIPRLGNKQIHKVNQTRENPSVTEPEKKMPKSMLEKRR